MSNDLVEKVARELADEDGCPDGWWDRTSDALRRPFREQAIIAIRVVLEEAAKKADSYANNAEYRAAGHENEEAQNAALNKMEAGLDLAAAIRSMMPEQKP